MSTENKSANTLKNSKGISSSKLLQALQKMLRNGGGSVSYIFMSTRFKRKNFINGKGEDDFLLEPEQVKAVQYMKVGNQALEGQKPGALKSPEELAQMFHTTKWDLGADYFTID